MVTAVKPTVRIKHGIKTVFLTTKNEGDAKEHEGWREGVRLKDLRNI